MAMRYEYEVLFPYLEGFEQKISFAAIATYLSISFGVNEYLLLMVQYLFVADFLIHIAYNFRQNTLMLQDVWQGIKKIISLYLGLVVVGLGTKAFDVALSDRLSVQYNGAFLYDLFVYFLIIFELASINKDLAGFGFKVNVLLQNYFEKFTRKLQRKADTFFEK